MNDETAEAVAFKLFKSALDMLALVRKLRAGLGHHFALDSGYPFIAFQFFRDIESLLELGESEFLDPSHHTGVDLRQRHFPLRFADLAPEFLLNFEQWLDRFVAGEQRL